MNIKGEQNHKRMVHGYFQEFHGYYSLDQTFHILIGISTIIWANMKEGNLGYNNIFSNRILNEHGNGYHILQKEIERLERGYYKFDGRLTSRYNN